MKRKVQFSYYCVVVTVGLLLLLCVGIVANLDINDKLVAMSVVTVAVVLVGLYYCPVSISADPDSVRIHRFLAGDKSFRYADIDSVDVCYPSAGGLRLCGSGGFFGYWGYFSDIIIGQYFGYYADRGQCFYIRLKSRRQYVVSCKDHVAMVAAIQAYLK